MHVGARFGQTLSTHEDHGPSAPSPAKRRLASSRRAQPAAVMGPVTDRRRTAGIRPSVPRSGRESRTWAQGLAATIDDSLRCGRASEAGMSGRVFANERTMEDRMQPTALNRPARHRDGPADRRPVRRQDARRIRRRRDQDRGARRRRPAAQLAPDQGRHLRLVAGAVAQQALDRARPAQRRRPGHRAQADRRGRRADRELPPRHARGLGHGLRGTCRSSTPAS